MELFRQGAQDYERLWIIREQLVKLRERGALNLLRETEEKLERAVELATQEADPVRPYRPLLSDFPEARSS